MKRVSSIAILSVIMPLAAFGYDYTITGDDFINLRSHSYSVEEITQNVYNTARSQNMNAPVFQTVENNETKYYKWIAPDLTQYKTVNNSDVFALTDQGNGYVDFLAVDENGNVSTQNYYYNQPVNGGGETISNTGVTDSIISDFFGTYSSIDTYEAHSVSNNGTINSVAGNFIHNGSLTVGGNSGLLNATNGVIENVFADFIQNTTCAISNYGNIENIVGDFIENDSEWDGGVISNSGSVGNIIGNFINNGGNAGNGGNAISNSGTISSITGSFLNNYTAHGGGAILNSGTIDSITGNFLNNIGTDDYAQGGAVFNDGTITFVNDVLFSGNIANFYEDHWNQGGFYDITYLNSGAIYNSSRGTINMNINGESSIRFATQSDGIYNAGTITANGSTVGTPGYLYLQSVDGNGTFSLNNIYAELASGQTIRQQNFNIDENSTLSVYSGGLNIDNLQNDGTLNLNGGSLSTMINGSGVTINNGELYSHPEYINQSFVNNGTLTFNGGELSRNISDYGNVTISQLTANADYIDQVVLNNGTLTLTGGTLLTDMPASWTGYTRVWDESLLDYTEVYTTLQNNGNIIIAGNVTSNANIAQSTTINAGGNLVISAEKIQTNSLNNDGILTLTGGTLTANMSVPYVTYDNIYDENLGYYTDVYTTHNNGNIVIDGDVVSNANIAQNITINENKSLTTSADRLVPYGYYIYDPNYGYAIYQLNELIITNNGSLNLTGGTLTAYMSINGTGSVVNTGDLYVNAYNISRVNNFINNGTLIFNGGTLSENISNYGNVSISQLTANADYIDQDITNGGTLTLTNGTLAHNITGENGNIFIGGNVASNANIAQSTTINAGGNLIISAEKIQTNSLNNDGILTLTGGTLTANMSVPYTTYDYIYDENLGYDTYVSITHNNGNIVIDGDVVSNANIAQNITINENKTLTTSADNMGRYLNDYGSYYDSYYNSYCSYADITLTNNGSLNLTGGTFNVNNISGGGNIMIDGDVTSNVNMAQNTIINENASLTVSVDNIKDTNLINYGTLWFSGTGTLDKALSNYGNAGNAGGTLTANADYIDRSFTNSGTLRLTDGTLSGQTDGYGSMIIDGNVVSNANIAQSYININADGNLVISAEKIQAYSLNNDGTLTLTGGTLSTNLSAPYTSYDWNYDENTGSYTEVYTTHNNGNVVIDGDVVSNVNIAQNITINENKTLTTSANNIGNVHISDPYWVYSYQEVSSDMALVNNGTLRLTDGTFSIANLSGDGNIVIDGNVISNVNMQNTTINDNGVLTVAAGFIKNIDITNNGSLFFAGEGTLEQPLSNYGGTTGNVGRLMTNADYIDQNFTNDGTLILTGGTLSTEIPVTDPTWTRTASYYDMNTGSYIDYNYTPGIMIIDGDVVADANILQETTINSGRILTASADNVRLNVLNNNGTLKLTGGTLEEGVSDPSHYIYSRGNIVIDGDVVSNVMFGQNRARVNMTINSEKSLTTNASNISYSSDLTFVNNGTLKLTGGTFSVNNISGNGNIVIDGEVGYFNINNGASTNQHFVVNNDKVLRFIGNILPSSMLTNNGTVVFDGYETLSENISNYGNVVIKYLDTDADFLDADVINEGELCLTGGTLSHLVSGNGMLDVNGNVAANTRIVQDIEIGDYNNSTLTISADNIAASKVHNWGTLKLTGGTLNVDLPESGTFTYNDGYEVHEFHEDYNGKVIIDGDVVANALIEQDTTINSGKSLTTSVDNIKNANLTNNGTLWFSEGTLDKTISSYGNAGNSGVLYANANHIDQEMVNNGTLNLTQGVLRSEITGSGNVFIRGNVTGSVDFENIVNIAENAKFTTNADSLLNESDINNNGILNITSGKLSQNVIGGKTVIANSAIIESTRVNDIDMNGTWNIGSKTVHASNTNINGTVNIDVNGISKNSDLYSGGKLIANSVNLGENSALRLVVADGNLAPNESTGNLRLVEADSWNGNWHEMFQNNARYDMTFDDNLHAVKFTYKKSVEDIVAEMGGSHNASVVINVWANISFSTNPVVQNIIDQLNYASQYDGAELINLLTSIAPTDSNVTSGTSRMVTSAIDNLISDRLSFLGRNGGDMMDGVSVWGQGLYNHSSQSGGAEFTGNTFGFSLGADKKITEDTVVGLGYTYSGTSAESGSRDINATGHTVFAYGEYRPYRLNLDESGNATDKVLSPWYVSGVLSYGMTDYEEEAGYGISSEYSTNTLGLNGNVGYYLTDNLDVFVGGRYLKISQDDYTDSIGQKISVKDDDVFTARFGGRYTGNGSVFIPTAHLELTYDVKSNDRLAVVNTENSSYQITGDAINPFGVQAGLGIISNIDNWKLSLNYDLEWHPEFVSHTGRIRAKYAF